ncbi:PorP/SprF family type IX secretion system membrane protein [Chitinophaga ginsengisoli]|uniref:Type IX secretion system PorP/SprF family membrane protein n=1 Tax=Chitinophaga ginsengisoli TaxID=363837 RepID=A0A2P8FPV0_9BACT|nr:PorP/SprF family type IX secretion system membrane protein [Chitinophaga ginsengisoli]PSL23685.1 type IX secretion system PorP/SprF family membrane protein [Chitinophaga ginsengisoli]
MSYKQNIRSFIVSSLLLAAGINNQVSAQSLSNAKALLEPSGTQYFQNQYLANPAMAGFEKGLHLNAAYRNQWNGIEGAPITKFFSADYAVGNRVGAGMHIFNDVAGLINRTRVALTYAYHLPLTNPDQQLHFGLSLAWNVQRIDYKNLDGDPNDPSVSAFNRRDNYFEAEYGMAYTDTKLTIQASLPNVRSLFTGDDKEADGGGIFFTAASYRFAINEAITSIEPKICYRGIRGFDNILDAGVNVSILNDVANVMAMYHTTKSVTAGVGVNILRTVGIQAMYTTQTGGIKTYVDGTYEIGATVHLFR